MVAVAGKKGPPLSLRNVFLKFEKKLLARSSQFSLALFFYEVKLNNTAGTSLLGAYYKVLPDV